MIHLRGPLLAIDDPDSQRTEAWVVDGRITYRKPAGITQTTLEGWVLPGLVDVHCHLGLNAAGPAPREETIEHALTDLRTGTTLVRDAGNPTDTRWIQQRTDLPRLIRAGQHIARPKRYLRNFAVELENPSQLPQEVAKQARAGDGWVKLVADWIDRSEGADSRLRPLWPTEILKDAIAAAHEEGARVTAHTFARETLDGLLDAGIDCIEHGCGMHPDHIDECARRSVPVTPTLLQVSHFDTFAAAAGTKYPVFGKQMREKWDNRYRQAEAIWAGGAPLLMGSDAGGDVAHGQLPAELNECVKAGIPARDVLWAATGGARRYLGQENLGEGHSADLCVYPRDPRIDPSVLNQPSAVLLRGRLVVGEGGHALPDTLD